MIPDSSPLPLPAPSARSILITILGELVYPDDQPVFTTTLIQVMRGLGVEDHAARQAISRSTAAGWMTSERQGRAVRWRLAQHGREVIEDGMRRSAAFLSESRPWDGRWLLLLVSVPQDQRTVRKQLYGGLSWLGLGNPTPGVWVSPHAEISDQVDDLVRRFDLRSSSLGFVGSTLAVGMSDSEIVSSAWDLSDLAERYVVLMRRYEALDPAPGLPLMLAHLELLNLLQRFMRLDPQLPEELLPDWVGRDGARLFRRRRQEWSAPALAHWRSMTSTPDAG